MSLLHQSARTIRCLLDLALHALSPPRVEGGVPARITIYRSGQ